MWYRFVVESTPLLNPKSLARLIIPLCSDGISPIKHYLRPPTPLPPTFFLAPDKPDESYYLTSHLNPNTSFVEFLWDESRSGGLYGSPALHAHVIKTVTDSERMFLPCNGPLTFAGITVRCYGQIQAETGDHIDIPFVGRREDQP